MTCSRPRRRAFRAGAGVLDPVLLIDREGLGWLFGMDRRGRLWQDGGPGPPAPRSLEGRTLLGPTGSIRDPQARRLARETGRFFLDAVDAEYPALPQHAHAPLDPQQETVDASVMEILVRDMSRALGRRDHEQEGPDA